MIFKVRRTRFLVQVQGATDGFNLEYFNSGCDHDKTALFIPSETLETFGVHDVMTIDAKSLQELLRFCFSVYICDGSFASIDEWQPICQTVSIDASSILVEAFYFKSLILLKCPNEGDSNKIATFYTISLFPEPFPKFQVDHRTLSNILTAPPCSSLFQSKGASKLKHHAVVNVDMLMQASRQEAAVRIQSQARRRNASNLANSIRQEKEQHLAATKIQCTHRQRRASAEVERLKREKSAIRIQSQVRRRSASKKVKMLKQQKSATKIQSQARRRSASNKVRALQLEKNAHDIAATIIQSKQRQRQASAEVERLKQEKQLEQAGWKSKVVFKIKGIRFLVELKKHDTDCFSVSYLNPVVSEESKSFSVNAEDLACLGVSNSHNLDVKSQIALLHFCFQVFYCDKSLESLQQMKAIDCQLQVENDTFCFSAFYKEWLILLKTVNGPETTPPFLFTISLEEEARDDDFTLTESSLGNIVCKDQVVSVCSIPSKYREAVQMRHHIVLEKPLLEAKFRTSFSLNWMRAVFKTDTKRFLVQIKEKNDHFVLKYLNPLSAEVPEELHVSHDSMLKIVQLDEEKNLDLLSKQEFLRFCFYIYLQGQTMDLLGQLPNLSHQVFWGNENYSLNLWMHGSMVMLKIVNDLQPKVATIWTVRLSPKIYYMNLDNKLFERILSSPDAARLQQSMYGEGKLDNSPQHLILTKISDSCNTGSDNAERQKAATKIQSQVRRRHALERVEDIKATKTDEAVSKCVDKPNAPIQSRAVFKTAQGLFLVQSIESSEKILFKFIDPTGGKIVESSVSKLLLSRLGPTEHLDTNSKKEIMRLCFHVLIDRNSPDLIQNLHMVSGNLGVGGISFQVLCFSYRTLLLLKVNAFAEEKAQLFFTIKINSDFTEDQFNEQFLTRILTTPKVQQNFRLFKADTGAVIEVDAMSLSVDFPNPSTNIDELDSEMSTKSKHGFKLAGSLYLVEFHRLGSTKHKTIDISYVRCSDMESTKKLSLEKEILQQHFGLVGSFDSLSKSSKIALCRFSLHIFLSQSKKRKQSGLSSTFSKLKVFRSGINLFSSSYILRFYHFGSLILVTLYCTNSSDQSILLVSLANWRKVQNFFIMNRQAVKYILNSDSFMNNIIPGSNIDEPSFRLRSNYLKTRIPADLIQGNRTVPGKSEEGSSAQNICISIAVEEDVVGDKSAIENGSIDEFDTMNCSPESAGEMLVAKRRQSFDRLKKRLTAKRLSKEIIEVNSLGAKRRQSQCRLEKRLTERQHGKVFNQLTKGDEHASQASSELGQRRRKSIDRLQTRLAERTRSKSPAKDLQKNEPKLKRNVSFDESNIPEPDTKLLKNDIHSVYMELDGGASAERGSALAQRRHSSKQNLEERLQTKRVNSFVKQRSAKSIQKTFRQYSSGQKLNQTAPSVVEKQSFSGPDSGPPSPAKLERLSSREIVDQRLQTSAMKKKLSQRGMHEERQRRDLDTPLATHTASSDLRNNVQGKAQELDVNAAGIKT